MLPDHMNFEGLEEIPRLTGFPDNDNPAFLTVAGNCPIIICAPHTGSEDTTPAVAKAFGNRLTDNTDDDTNTLKITFALIRTLSAMGAVPHAVINMVSRNYMDLNRTWSGQGEWEDSAANTTNPTDDQLSLAQFPRIAEFQRFRDTYYQGFHDVLRRFTEANHPNGWLFDIHGTGLHVLNTPTDTRAYNLQIATAQGFTAGRHLVYDSSQSLHRYLYDGGRGFEVHPNSSNPGDEFITVKTDGNVKINLNSGGRYGAQNPPAQASSLPITHNVIPGPQQRRINGVQFEIDGSLRRNGRTDEQLESVGINLAYAIYNAMLGNGIIQRVPNPLSGSNARECYQALNG